MTTQTLYAPIFKQGVGFTNQLFYIHPAGLAKLFIRSLYIMDNGFGTLVARFWKTNTIGQNTMIYRGINIVANDIFKDLNCNILLLPGDSLSIDSSNNVQLLIYGIQETP